MPRVKVALLLLLLSGCNGAGSPGPPVMHWYVFDEPSGAFTMAAEHCTRAANGRYRIELTPLPADADQQREQLVRRLAAGDEDIDIIGMDVIWTAEFAQAG
jgi:multiple sugar transport system substrate-binding protein